MFKITKFIRGFCSIVSVHSDERRTNGRMNLQFTADSHIRLRMYSLNNKQYCKEF